MRQQPRFVPLRFERLDPAEQTRRVEEFLARLSSRRTVRDFSSEAVPFHLVRDAIRAAAAARSGAKRQPWRFVVVAEPAVSGRSDRGGSRGEGEATSGGCRRSRSRSSRLSAPTGASRS